MSSPPHPHTPISGVKPLDPFRRAVLRGLGVLLPPLLTIVIFLWVGNTVMRYVLRPLENATRYVLVEHTSDIRAANEFTKPPKAAGEAVSSPDDKLFRRTPDGLFIPEGVYTTAEERRNAKDAPPTTAREYYTIYVNEVWLQPWIVIPIFLWIFLVLLYSLGKFLAAGIGRFFWGQFEALITRVPLVSNVYSSVKQVTDFLFTDPDLDITRVVAVEYPRKGIWTVAFVTGDSMLDIQSAANESVMSVLIPTSPMPFTGFTITVKKSESIDLNITVDQAFQFVVSCGVVIPPQQLTSMTKRTTDLSDNGSAIAGPAPELARGMPPVKGVMHLNGAESEDDPTAHSAPAAKTESPQRDEGS